MPITVCKFSKIFRGSMPPNPPRIIIVSLFASNLTLPQKMRLKTSKIGAKKFGIYCTPFTWTHFLKRAYVYALFRI